MTDDPKHLLWRLRNNDTAKHLCGLAADRIAALEEALRWIKEMPLPAPPLDDPAHSMRTIATRALEGKPHE